MQKWKEIWARLDAKIAPSWESNRLVMICGVQLRCSWWRMALARPDECTRSKGPTVQYPAMYTDSTLLSPML